jgi:hypothetical protein
MADSVNDLNDHDMDDVPSIKKEESVSSNGATSVGLSDRDKVQHRKPHQKSRMGCTQCKARRVKVCIMHPIFSVHIIEWLYNSFPSAIAIPKDPHKIE